MAFTYFYILALMLAIGSCKAASAAEGSPQNYYQLMDDALNRRDTEAMIGLLAELDSAEIWSFGAGLGPTDAESLQTRAVQVFSDHLLDSQGRLKLSDEISNTTLSANCLCWIRLFHTDPSDQRALLQLLKDDNPAVRYLGLKKASSVAEIDSAIIDTVRNIAGNDPYVQISRKTTHHIDNRPAPMGMTLNEFICPLREFACMLLNRWRHSCELDNTSIGREGVKAMARLWEQAANRRNSVEEAIKALDPKGAGAEAVKELGGKAESSSAFAVFYRAIQSAD